MVRGSSELKLEEAGSAWQRNRQAEWPESRAGPSGRNKENLIQFFTIWALAGLTPFLAVAIVRTVFLPGRLLQEDPAAGCFNLYSRFHIKQECQQSVLFPEAPVVLTHAEANVN
jgi:hypothetical protein